MTIFVLYSNKKTFLYKNVRSVKTCPSGLSILREEDDDKWTMLINPIQITLYFHELEDVKEKQ